MKKSLQFTFGVLAIGAVLALQSCDKLKDAVPSQKIDFTGASADIVIPASNDVTAKGEVGETSFNYDLDYLIKSQTDSLLNFSNIESVKITSLTLTLNDGDQTNNFANFEYAGATFNTNANNGSYDPYTIAYIENNPDNYSVKLVPAIIDADQDVKKYFSSNMVFHYAVIAKLRRATTKTLHCHIAVSYDINVKA